MASGFCGACGRPVPLSARFCPACGTPTSAIPLARPVHLPAAGFAGPPVPPSGLSTFGTTPPGRRQRRIKPLWIVIAISVVVAGVLVALFTVPVTMSFSENLTVPGGGIATYFTSFRGGVQVSGTWQSLRGGPVNFTLSGPLGIVSSQSGVSGTFSFVAFVGPYFFEVASASNATVTISGSYSAPIL